MGGIFSYPLLLSIQPKKSRIFQSTNCKTELIVLTCLLLTTNALESSGTSFSSAEERTVSFGVEITGESVLFKIDNLVCSAPTVEDRAPAPVLLFKRCRTPLKRFLLRSNYRI